MTLRQIEIFLNVVNMGHLTNVAKDMDLSQSAISMSIKELETIIGRKLFDRINKRLVLNEVGRAFFKEIKPLYKKIIDIQNEFQNSPKKGLIRVGASTTIVDYLMPPIICQYMDSYPEVQISLKEGNTKYIVELIKNGEIDVGFVEGYVQDVEIIKEKIGVDELVIVTSSDAFQTPCLIDVLSGYKWALSEKGSGTREIFLDYIKGKVDNLNIFLELGHTESIKSILKDRVCFACLSKIAVEKEIEEGTLYEVPVKKFECKRDFLMIFHKDKYHSELFDKFTHFVKKMIAQTLESKQQ
ncbi:MAG TPA: LysR family transcriptional regulator [Epsilonproteobacteria bacterium]|nr:LysR family transcriptional regulator [Campylobacterota bacterium]